MFSDGTTSPPQFTYTYNDTTAVYNTQTWTFSTVADADGTITVPYTYVGFHAFFQVRVFLTAFVTHNGVTTPTPLVNAGPINCCTPPSGGFSYTGSANFSVASGDTYGFTLGAATSTALTSSTARCRWYL